LFFVEYLKKFTLLHPKSIDLSLGRTINLLEKLGSPHKKLPPIVHIAGTNGKGSVVAYIQSILNNSGYTVQTYTSPHLINFNERIRLANGLISDAYLKELLEECYIVNKR
jgi:Folylpolyglutamate synthase